MLAHKGYQSSICAPDHIFYRGAVNLSYGLLLLDIVKNDGSGGTKNETGGTSVENLVCWNRWLNGLDDSIRQVPNLNKLEQGVKSLLASHKNRNTPEWS